MKIEQMFKADHGLVAQAIEARERAYAPYSQFAVGAALLCADGSVVRGCNIENAAFGPSNCAERTAVFRAVSEGKREFQAIAVVGGKIGCPLDFIYPCGVCRQVLWEFCGPDFQVIVTADENRMRVHTLAELLPHGFGPPQLR